MQRGTTLPLPPWKAAAVGTKRPRVEGEDAPPAKQQKIAAAEIMERDTTQVSPWANESGESDF